MTDVNKFKKYHIHSFWDDAYLQLDYVHEPFNDTFQMQTWQALGFANRFTGDMCDMRRAQPTWNQRIVDLFAGQGWLDIGTSYYRMRTGTVLPTHRDSYVKYISLFGLQGREHTIRRAINWHAGAVIEWIYDTPHMAANLGPTPRYTLQITGHVDD